jgi:hypothetical protein
MSNINFNIELLFCEMKHVLILDTFVYALCLYNEFFKLL